jgi:chromosome segregation ATPase
MTMLPLLPIPQRVPDFSKTNVVDARDVFPESKPVKQDPRTPFINDLMKAPPSDQRDQLMSQFLMLADRIDAFLAQSKSERTRELEKTRDDLWNQCRSAEDALQSLQRDLGTEQAQLNEANFRLATIRERAAEASTRPFTTRFPTKSEIAAWNSTRDAAAAEVGRAEKVVREHQIRFNALQNQIPEAAQDLRDAVEQLQEVQRALAGS